MSFPWSHQEFMTPVLRTIPRDIDDMPAILHVDYGLQDRFQKASMNGKLDRFRSAKDFPRGEDIGGQATARRTDDPGVIELSILKEKAHTPSLDEEATTKQRMENASKGPAEPGKNVPAEPNGQKRKSRKRKAPGGAAALGGSEEVETLHLTHFERIQAAKKRKLDSTRVVVEKKRVSVRFGCVSSRSTIFAKGAESRSSGGQPPKRPILLPAFLPLEVHNGRSLITQTAVRNAADLGTYDCRYATNVFEQEHEKSHKLKRISTGRTRLLWTKIHLGKPPPGALDTLAANRNRVSYSSLLTGHRMETGFFKRPRDVSLGIRIGGKLVVHMERSKRSTSPKPTVGKPHEELTGDEAVGSLSGVSEKAFNAAVTEAAGKETGEATALQELGEVATAIPLPTVTALPRTDKPKKKQKGHPMCSFDPDLFLMRLLRERRANRKFDSQGEPDEESVVFTSESKALQIVQVDLRSHPIYECLPMNGGKVRVICTVTGNLKPCWLPSIFNDSLASSKSSSNRASGSPNAGDKSATSRETLGEPDTPENGTSRRRKSRTPARFRNEETSNRPSKPSSETPSMTSTTKTNEKCCLCPHYGGALSPMDESAPEKGLVHEVCRSWTTKRCIRSVNIPDKLESNPLLEHVLTSCSICGLGAKSEKVDRDPLVKCAAAGCLVRFHPMCAKVVSTVASMHKTDAPMSSTHDLDETLRVDKELASQYSLTTMRVTPKASKKIKGSTPLIVPLAFCGFHNPNREASFYGGYPGSDYIGECMRLPSTIAD